MIKSFSAVNSSSILPRPSRRESPHAGECALKSPSTRKGFGSCSKSSATETFETWELGGRYREQTVRVFSRLIVAAIDSAVASVLQRYFYKRECSIEPRYPLPQTIYCLAGHPLAGPPSL
ncbi:hypothetical protein PoB_004592200 [Plakobranchus ocellatus]|uniref:HORMA domain-containing protein n=1 Tax=Plakobranchus ocellatus TaxID=259542 RepID=A0AAV4BJ95_9GAST|nr:hypothetical protein PoB_004592200 [Plakobranchus ocellatus]